MKKREMETGKNVRAEVFYFLHKADAQWPKIELV